MSRHSVPGRSAAYRAASVDLPTPGGPLRRISRVTLTASSAVTGRLRRREPLKYAVVERERRWLLGGVPPFPDHARQVRIEDRYVVGTRLRLRRGDRGRRTVVRKLGHKIRLGADAAEVAHTSLYLDDAEWDLLVALPARTLTKTRTLVPIPEGHVAVDVHADGTVLAEIDGDGELPEGWPVVREVTTEEVSPAASWRGSDSSSSGTATRHLRGRARRRRLPSVEDMRWLALVLLGLYTYVVGLLTLGGTSSVGWAFGVTDQYYRLSEAQANVLLFVPAGFLLAVVLLSPVLATAAGVLGSMAIEWFQAAYLPTRVADAHDVIHNGTGALIGAVVAVPIVWVLSRRRRPARTSRPGGRSVLLRGVDGASTSWCGGSSADRSATRARSSSADGGWDGTRERPSFSCDIWTSRIFVGPNGGPAFDSPAGQRQDGSGDEIRLRLRRRGWPVRTAWRQEHARRRGGSPTRSTGWTR